LVCGKKGHNAQHCTKIISNRILAKVRSGNRSNVNNSENLNLLFSYDFDADPDFDTYVRGANVFKDMDDSNETIDDLLDCFFRGEISEIEDPDLYYIGASKKNVRIPIFLYAANSLALVDCGASISVISSRFIDKIVNGGGVVNIHERKTIKIQIANGSIINSSKLVEVDLVIDGVSFSHCFYILDIPYDVLLGMDFLDSFGFTLDFKTKMLFNDNVNLSWDNKISSL